VENTTSRFFKHLIANHEKRMTTKFPAEEFDAWAET
jgi:hypothetical protein